MNASIRPSVFWTRYLRSPGEILPTCYITSHHGKGVREQHYFIFPCVRPAGPTGSHILGRHILGTLHRISFITSITMVKIRVSCFFCLFFFCLFFFCFFCVCVCVCFFFFFFVCVFLCFSFFSLLFRYFYIFFLSMEI